MPDPRRRSCKRCKAHDSVVGLISWEGYCGECGKIVVIANMDGIHEKRGPAYERRRYGIAVKEFGPRVALALKHAGVFGELPVDDWPPYP